jgi:hypothetical protein
MGFTGIGLLFALVTGGLLAWIGPLAPLASNKGRLARCRRGGQPGVPGWTSPAS